MYLRSTIDENHALNGRTIDAEGRLSSLSASLDVADLERGLPASGEGRPGDDRRLAAVDDNGSVVGGLSLKSVAMSMKFLEGITSVLGEVAKTTKLRNRQCL